MSHDTISDAFIEACEDNEHAYHELAEVLLAAFHQATEGKGDERHAQGQAFDNQPMQQISQLLNTRSGMLYQAIKKLQESTRLGELPAHAERLGAIIYIAGASVYEDKEQ